MISDMSQVDVILTTEECQTVPALLACVQYLRGIVYRERHEHAQERKEWERRGEAAMVEVEGRGVIGPSVTITIKRGDEVIYASQGPLARSYSWAPPTPLGYLLLPDGRFVASWRFLPEIVTPEQPR